MKIDHATGQPVSLIILAINQSLYVLAIKILGMTVLSASAPYILEEGPGVGWTFFDIRIVRKFIVH